MAEEKKQFKLFPFLKFCLLQNLMAKEVRKRWVFHDIKFETPEIEKKYEEHRLEAIRKNWHFIMLVLKISFAALFILFSFDAEIKGTFRKV